MPRASDFIETHFDDDIEEMMGNVHPTVRGIARHMAHNDSPPDFFPFEERDDHDLETIAASMLDESINDREQVEHLRDEYQSQDRMWKNFYPTFAHFKNDYESRSESRASS